MCLTDHGKWLYRKANPLNRRELFQTIAATVAGAGVAEASLSAVSTEATPALMVLEHPRSLSAETIARLSKGLSENLAGTPFQNVKCLVLTDGLRLTMLDASGKVLNERIEPEVPIRRELEEIDLTHWAGTPLADYDSWGRQLKPRS